MQQPHLVQITSIRSKASADAQFNHARPWVFPVQVVALLVGDHFEGEFVMVA